MSLKLLDLIKSTFFVVSFVLCSCGPVETKVHSVPGEEEERSKREELQSAEANLKAQKEQLEAQTKELSLKSQKALFVFDERDKSCKNSEGIKGYNTNPEMLGPCSLISDLVQFNKVMSLKADNGKKIDMRGSMIFSLVIPKTVTIKDFDFSYSTWVNTNLNGVKSINTVFTGARYYISDPKNSN